VQASHQISRLGTDLFGNNNIDATILRFEEFFTLIGSPVRLSQVGIGEDKFEEIIQLMIRNKAEGSNYKLTEDDYRKILAFAR